MNDGKNISIRAVEQNDLEAVIQLLQSISEFKPSRLFAGQYFQNSGDLIRLVLNFAVITV